MLDPRIYRNGMMIVVLALIVLAFSLGNQPAPLSASLVPDAFDGPAAYATMNMLALRYPDRTPGSHGDNHLADYVAGALAHDRFAVHRSAFTAQTADGARTVQTVTGTVAGTTPGTIVVVAHRDSPITGDPADLSGTAVLLELARVLSTQTQQRSIVLASTTAQVGAAGAAQVARSLPGPVDAVIVLGDLAGLQTHPPLVLPWSDTQLVAPPLLRNTAAAALAQQANLAAPDDGVGGQFLHLAFPLASTEQAPFVAAGEPAVLISASGAHLPAADEPTRPDQITRFGRAVLQTVSALGTGASVPAPSSYLRWQGKLIPVWAIRLLVLALILPVLGATIDGLARTRRRGYRVGRWVLWVLSACVPFVLAIVAVLALPAAGAIAAAPPGPVTGDALRLPAGAVPILVGLVLVIALAFVARWRLERRLRSTAAAAAVAPEPADARANGRRHAQRPPRVEDAASPAAAGALLLVLCATALIIWVENPFAAALIVPALHFWMWIVAPEQRLRAPWAVLLFAAGLAPGFLAALYYAATLGLGPAAAAWNAVLMVAGGSVSVISAIEWSVVLGCAVSLALMIVRIARQPRPRPAETPLTVRGPLTYAGPGSLGGTKSALRR